MHKSVKLLQYQGFERGSNPVEALIFFRLLLSNCLNWKKKIHCDDHSSLSEYCLSCGFEKKKRQSCMLAHLVS